MSNQKTLIIILALVVAIVKGFVVNDQSKFEYDLKGKLANQLSELEQEYNSLLTLKNETRNWKLDSINKTWQTTSKMEVVEKHPEYFVLDEDKFIIDVERENQQKMLELMTLDELLDKIQDLQANIQNL
jgi:hypothetical protein